MKIVRRGVAPFATGVSTNMYHMLPLCGTNPAWPQALLGRPAIAGCSPMLPRCGTSASLIRHQPSVVSRRSSCSPNPALCAFAALRLCVNALSHSCVSCVLWSIIRGISVNSRKYLQLNYLQNNEPVSTCNCDTCAYLQLVAASCNYLQQQEPVNPCNCS